MALHQPVRSAFPALLHRADRVTARFAGLAAIAALGALPGCNRYAMFNVAGYEQVSYSNQADILFVIDNSPSMVEETASLGLNFNTFIETLRGSEPPTGSLEDAVANYVTYTSDRGSIIDYHLAITSTSVDYDRFGDSDGVDPGEAGRLLGDPTVVARGGDDVEGDFRRNLLCEAASWNESALTSDSAYICGTPLGPDDLISLEYLDCECGIDGWQGNSGSGQEEPLEAAYLALCRSVEEPPEGCYDPLSPFIVPPEYTNDGFLRDDSTVVVVIVSDEGDNSRRLSQGEADPQPYLDLLSEFERPIKIVAIGPYLDPATGGVKCADAVPTWSVERLQDAATVTGGFYQNIVAPGASDDACELSDFATYLEQLGDLLNNLQTVFQLQSVPDTSTIQVWIDGEEIPSATIENADAISEDPSTEPIYADGWSYDSAQNAVVFWPDQVPGYNADVRIYYRPLSGNPRELPF